MALSKTRRNLLRAGEIAVRMQEIIETTWARDPKLNHNSAVEFRYLKKELENMDLTVSWETQLLISPTDPSGFKLNAKVTVLIPQSSTVH